MAKQTLTYNSTSGNWELTETNQGKTYTNTLLTNNKNISGDIDINITARNATASMPASLSGSSASASLSGTNITLVKTLTNTASITQAGWVDSLSGNTEVSLSGTVPTETKSVKSSSTTATITPTSGKLISEITVQPIVLEEKSVDPTTATQTITASSGKDGLSKVVISPIPSSYTIPSGTITLTQQTGTDVTSKKYADVRGATVNSPVAEEGSISGNKVTITPKVNISQAGWVNSGTITGTAVTVEASDLVSGSTPITDNGTYTVTNYETVEVNVPKGITPSGNITITQQSGTDVTEKATADVREASDFVLSVVTNSDEVTVGAASNGYYLLSNPVTATLTAGTPGWYSNGI